MYNPYLKEDVCPPVIIFPLTFKNQKPQIQLRLLSVLNCPLITELCHCLSLNLSLLLYCHFSLSTSGNTMLFSISITANVSFFISLYVDFPNFYPLQPVTPLSCSFVCIIPASSCLICHSSQISSHFPLFPFQP